MNSATTSPTVPDAEGVAQTRSPLREFWAAFRENRGAVFGLAIVVLVALAPVPA